MANQDTIREVQLAELQMLHAFDFICRKYNIQYFAFAGTLLGAIRHQGYIPWDDDLDLGMLRSDFEKLKMVPKAEWGSQYELVDPAQSDVIHDKLFPRVYLKHSIIQSYTDVYNWINPVTGKSWYTSLMLDIYVFDVIPDDYKQYRSIRKRVQNAKKKYKTVKLIANSSHSKGLTKIKTIIKKVYGNTIRLLRKEPWKDLCIKSDRWISKGRSGKRIGCYYFSLERMYFPKEKVFPLKYVKFEDMMIPIPRNYKDFLHVMYGESYMTPPPLEDRYHINFIYLKLPEGKEFVIDPIEGSLGAGKNEVND